MGSSERDFILVFARDLKFSGPSGIRPPVVAGATFGLSDTIVILCNFYVGIFHLLFIFLYHTCFSIYFSSDFIHKIPAKIDFHIL